MELLEAFDPQAEFESMEAGFPRLSINSGQIVRTVPLGAVPDRVVRLELISQCPESILSKLTDKLAQGGCAAVICNTVGRAQQVYEAIRDSGVFSADQVILFHSRFPFCWREQREKDVLAAFGRLDQPTTEVRGKIVVATQVIEQSLDLDFDLLISDLAPLDLLIQRIGRLQRHSGMAHPPLRPPGLGEPVCVVTMPDQQEGKLAHFGSDTYIYDEIFLQLSFFVLREQTALSLPGDSDTLIEAVYSEEDLPDLAPEQHEALRVLYKKMLRKADDQSIGARNRLIADVDYAEVLGASQVDYAEDDPNAHRDLQALTRDTRPSVQVVCLERDAQGRLFLLDEHTPFDLDRQPFEEALNQALRSSISISNWRVVEYYRGQPPHDAWKKSAHLRYFYPAIFEGGVCTLTEGLVLQLDHEVGLKVSK
jgi:CRISPR-associated endonuclease/helicase Cas3